MKNCFKFEKLPVFILLGVISGIIVGIFYHNASVFAPLGQIYLNALFCAAVPLVFFTISSTIAKHNDSVKTAKIFFSIITLFIITAIISFFFMYLCIVIVNPSIETLKVINPIDKKGEIDIPALVVSFLTQPDFILLFSKKAILPLIFASVLFGFSVAKSGGEQSPAGKFLINMNEVLNNLMGILNLFAPIGLFGFFADLVAQNSHYFADEIAFIVIMLHVVCILYMVIFAPLYAYLGAGTKGVRVMLKHIAPSLIMSFATGSSVATIPTNLKLTKESGVPDDIANMIIPLGATMHMDGVALLECLRIILLFPFFGMELTTADLLLAAVISIVLSVATPGIPGANISSLVVCSIFFPENFAVAYGIRFAIAIASNAVCTAVNASMDYVVSFIVARIFYGKKWLEEMNC